MTMFVCLVAIAIRCVLIGGYFAAWWGSGGSMALIAACSESFAVFATCYAYLRGVVDRSWAGCLLPFLHLPVLLFDLRNPCGPDLALGFYLIFWLVQLALRVRMGLCCTVAVPCFLRLLDAFPYNIVRHPLALTELLIAAAIAWRYESSHNWGVFVLVVICNYVIVSIEESFLRSQQSYSDYCKRVKWRYLPGLV